MRKVSIEEALETYRMTMKNCPVEEHAEWVKAVTYALLTEDSSALVNHPAHAMEVYFKLRRKNPISTSDEIKKQSV